MRRRGQIRTLRKRCRLSQFYKLWSKWICCQDDCRWYQMVTRSGLERSSCRLNLRNQRWTLRFRRPSTLWKHREANICYANHFLVTTESVTYWVVIYWNPSCRNLGMSSSNTWDCRLGYTGCCWKRQQFKVLLVGELTLTLGQAPSSQQMVLLSGPGSCWEMCDKLFPTKKEIEKLIDRKFHMFAA